MHFSFIRIYFIKAQVLYFFLSHEPIFHPALNVVNLELLAALRHELVLVETSVVADSMFLALVEVVQRERAFVRRSLKTSFTSH